MLENLKIHKDLVTTRGLKMQLLCAKTVEINGKDNKTNFDPESHGSKI